jgi:hypothetical protein
VKLHQYNPELKIDENAFAWRYMNFKKAWDMLANNTIYFARLDSFDDPIEGLPIEYRGKFQTKRILRYNTTAVQFSQIPEVKLPSQLEIDNWQKRDFCSCWYLTETNLMQYEADPHHESLAMWNYLECDEGFLLKIRFQELYNLVDKSVNDIAELNLIDVRYGKVYYLNYGEFDRLLKSQDKVFMPALIKHNSYKFENELRFVILSNYKFGSTDVGNGIPIRLNEALNSERHQIELFSHPNMTEIQFKTFRKKFSDIGIDLKLSTILSRSVVSNLLEKP